MAVIEAKDFSPTRGHVAQGNQIVFTNETLTIKSVAGGWVLIDKNEVEVSKVFRWAEDLHWFLIYCLT